MEIFGAWLFIIGLFLHPIIFIIGCILSIKYKDDIYLNEIILNISNYSQFLCWVCIAGGMLLVCLF
jgi:hypothetical protein